ncbi:MAG: Ribosomal RNA small subunit methyltransferase A [candidate division WS6 bacterium OLB20]|uniref:Ribosomal RNA small subunit methyltransferase A n=1 Tax=candidate division WS6 bacterium OLB20 TaxID=1617426 RepID=A0A136LXR0_9BACT|nr:MAG: Ribosomal RNA small subunit methyltransferase A [candidate division WS6 bacterium OLB20]
MHTFKKHYGQNFLTNSRFVIELVAAAELNPQTRVLEVGPGDGAVTEFLLEQAHDVTSVEIDTDLIAPLSAKFSDYISNGRYRLLNDDILRFDPEVYFGTDPYTVVGSLPYNISKKIISLFLQSSHKPEKMSLILQKEVAVDYVTPAPKASFLHTVTALYADCRLVETIPAKAFYPEPKVDGGIMTISPVAGRYSRMKELIRFIKIGFSSPRKKSQLKSEQCRI